jgi:hypothetical protein
MFGKRLGALGQGVPLESECAVTVNLHNEYCAGVSATVFHSVGVAEFAAEAQVYGVSGFVEIGQGCYS